MERQEENKVIIPSGQVDFRCDVEDRESRRELDGLLAEFGVEISDAPDDILLQYLEHLVFRKGTSAGESKAAPELQVFLEFGTGHQHLLFTIRAGKFDLVRHAENPTPATEKFPSGQVGGGIWWVLLLVVVASGWTAHYEFTSRRPHVAKLALVNLISKSALISNSTPQPDSLLTCSQRMVVVFQFGLNYVDRHRPFYRAFAPGIYPFDMGGMHPFSPRVRNLRKLFLHWHKTRPEIGVQDAGWRSTVVRENEAKVLNHGWGLGPWLDKQPRSLADNNGFGIQQSGVSGLASLVTLPTNDEAGSNDGPSSDSFRPCHEYVPPWRVILAALSLFGAGMFLFNGDGKANTRFLAGSLIFFAGVMLLSGHHYYCRDGNSYPYDPFQHAENLTLVSPEINEVYQ